MINKGQNCFRLKESFKTKQNQVSDIECNRLIEHGKKIGKNERLRLSNRLIEHGKKIGENVRLRLKLEAKG